MKFLLGENSIVIHTAENGDPIKNRVNRGGFIFPFSGDNPDLFSALELPHQMLLQTKERKDWWGVMIILLYSLNI
jgi:hypothetical protein